MLVPNSNFHLTYCTNIHQGESWEEVFRNLKEFIIPIKESLSPREPYGIGLRLSNRASIELKDPATINIFKAWLDHNHLYVFTLNGFPYGEFHNSVVKENVHRPDWRTKERLEYTLRLFEILAALLPSGIEGGISTSPITYKYWLQDEVEIQHAFRLSTSHLVSVALRLNEIFSSTGILLHLDIEPEPDGLLENTAETVHFFQQWLFKHGAAEFAQQTGLSDEEARVVIKRHIQVCYDVCHFAIEYERPEDVFQEFLANEISVGKIQISAALKAIFDNSKDRKASSQRLQPFAESTYLHQVIQRNTDGTLSQFRDLELALAESEGAEAVEWRIHFHVPIFLRDYHLLQSTQDDIIQTLHYLKTNAITKHLEVETYTWDVLPMGMRMGMKDGIVRELDWVLQNLKMEKA